MSSEQPERTAERVLGNIRETAAFVEVDGDDLFTMTHVPAQSDARGAVLICASLHAEALSNYRAEVQLARRLAADGWAVLRFHYVGTGHSTGDGTRLGLDSMSRDAIVARDSLERIAPGVPAAVVAVRAGALVAGSIVAAGDAGLVLWEPLVQGRAYFKEAQRAAALHELVGEDRSPEVAVEDAEAGPVTALGYELWPELQRSLTPAALPEGLTEVPRHVLLVQMRKLADLRKPFRSLADSLRARGAEVDTHLLNEEPSWWLLGRPLSGVAELVGETATWLAERAAAEAVVR